MPRGQKTCAVCGKPAGPRTKVCACGVEFPIKTKTKTPAPAHRASDILPDPPPPDTPPPPETPMPETPAENPEDRPLCQVHPKYKAIKPPRAPCEICWRAYVTQAVGDGIIRVKPLDEARTVTITDRQSLSMFIDALNKAYDKSHHGGGCYSAFLHTKEFVLQVDVHLSWKQE